MQHAKTKDGDQKMFPSQFLESFPFPGTAFTTQLGGCFTLHAYNLMNQP